MKAEASHAATTFLAIWRLLAYIASGERLGPESRSPATADCPESAAKGLGGTM